MTDDIGNVDEDVLVASLIFMVIPVPLGNCLVGCLVCGESICCFDAVVLLLVVVVDVDGTVF